ncbi:MAG TPA: hypothetical protein VFM70_10690 [Salinimicrobium sp.]|nr:hypothetical protein [Salinimicrobium sp.]
MMKLTGKALEDFGKYLQEQSIAYDENMDQYPKSFLVENFSRVPEAMQWGVYQDFFDKQDLTLYVEKFIDGSYDYTIVGNHFLQNVDFEDGTFKNLNEARAAAIEKATEIFNNKK